MKQSIRCLNKLACAFMMLCSSHVMAASIEIPKETLLKAKDIISQGCNSPQQYSEYWMVVDALNGYSTDSFIYAVYSHPMSMSFVKISDQNDLNCGIAISNGYMLLKREKVMTEYRPDDRQRYDFSIMLGSVYQDFLKNDFAIKQNNLMSIVDEQKDSDLKRSLSLDFLGLVEKMRLNALGLIDSSRGFNEAEKIYKLNVYDIDSAYRMADFSDDGCASSVKKSLVKKREIESKKLELFGLYFNAKREADFRLLLNKMDDFENAYLDRYKEDENASNCDNEANRELRIAVAKTEEDVIIWLKFLSIIATGTEQDISNFLKDKENSLVVLMRNSHRYTNGIQQCWKGNLLINDFADQKIRLYPDLFKKLKTQQCQTPFINLGQKAVRIEWLYPHYSKDVQAIERSCPKKADLSSLMMLYTFANKKNDKDISDALKLAQSDTKELLDQDSEKYSVISQKERDACALSIADVYNGILDFHMEKTKDSIENHQYYFDLKNDFNEELKDVAL